MKNLSIIALIPLCACATILDGTTQKVSVNTIPPAASCEFFKNDQKVASLGSTPGFVTVDKTKDDLTIKCFKQGFREIDYINHSGMAPAGAGNIILGGVIGAGVDSATGADNHYTSVINLEFARK